MAQFFHPNRVAIDSQDDIYVADTANHSIRKIDPLTCQLTTYAGQNGIRGSNDGALQQATFAWPSGIAVDQSGVVYVGDTINNKIR